MLLPVVLPGGSEFGLPEIPEAGRGAVTGRREDDELEGMVVEAPAGPLLLLVPLLVVVRALRGADCGRVEAGGWGGGAIPTGAGPTCTAEAPLPGRVEVMPMTGPPRTRVAEDALPDDLNMEALPPLVAVASFLLAGGWDRNDGAS